MYSSELGRPGRCRSLAKIARFHVQLAQLVGQRFEAADDDVDHCGDIEFSRVVWMWPWAIHAGARRAMR